MDNWQGFNTGVVLYDLAKMRQSQDYLEELDIDRHFIYALTVVLVLDGSSGISAHLES